MAIISKNDQNPESGGGAADPGAAPAQPNEVSPPRHNLPLKAAPVVGRKPEMQRVVGIFEQIRREGRPRRVEVAGPSGIGEIGRAHV